MGSERPSYARLRERLVSREPMLGTFVKMPTSQAIEILGAEGFDFVVIDGEHAPLDRNSIDLMVLASRAAGVAPIVRVGHPDHILTALDCGALGVMVPHVSSVASAQAVAAACRYAGGTRGFAGLTRAAGWGARKPLEHLDAQDSEVVCIAMIEDREAVERAAEIAAVDGIHALFVGRGDLAATFGSDPDAAAKVAALSQRVAKAAKDANKPLLMLATSTADAAGMRALGVAALLVSSDHGMLKSAAAAAVRDYSHKVS
jgi:staphyloferrin B biosynthesis citrate synthase